MIEETTTEIGSKRHKKYNVITESIREQIIHKVTNQQYSINQVYYNNKYTLLRFLKNLM